MRQQPETTSPAVSGPPFGRVRPAIWALLVFAILVAMLAPAGVLWRGTVTGLRAHVCFAPSPPRAGEPTRLLIELTDPVDRAAIRGPWASASVEWDMVDMPMRYPPAVVSGTAHDSGFGVPIKLTMAGRWWLRVELRTPGRPLWQAMVHFDVLPAHLGNAAAVIAPPPPDSLTACVIPVATPDRSGGA
jgi:hypothetical protein